MRPWGAGQEAHTQLPDDVACLGSTLISTSDTVLGYVLIMGGKMSD